jgi:hypothetical protein
MSPHKLKRVRKRPRCVSCKQPIPCSEPDVTLERLAGSNAGEDLEGLQELLEDDEEATR